MRNPANPAMKEAMATQSMDPTNGNGWEFLMAVRIFIVLSRKVARSDYSAPVFKKNAGATAEVPADG
jgi:hypothetical protein